MLISAIIFLNQLIFSEGFFIPQPWSISESCSQLLNPKINTRNRDIPILKTEIFIWSDLSLIIKDYAVMVRKNEMSVVMQEPKLCTITARQYGEVVLPDEASGQGPGTLARKLSRCKEGMAHFLPSWYKFYCVLARSRYKFDRSREFIPSYKAGGWHWRSVAVQTISETEICHGAGI